jgi:uncharacterized protein (TIGR02722 family)
MKSGLPSFGQSSFGQSSFGQSSGVFRKRVTRLAIVALGMVMVSGAIGCATSSTTRHDVGDEIDLSGEWNDVDSQRTSQEMITQCLSRSWPEDWKSETGKKPRVIIGRVANLSMEHLNTNTFVKDLERELINSGRVGFVASKDQRKGIHSERDHQEENASMATMKTHGQEVGADFMLMGEIDQINDARDGEEVRYYQISLEMINIGTGEKVWIGQHKIKKMVKRSGVRF